ncbi:hypothetical protein BANRA_01538 [Acinetobacter baumannii]|nr:hypothetical protein BANRA_01538 [Acinetobacter baumannii]
MANNSMIAMNSLNLRFYIELKDEIIDKVHQNGHLLYHLIKKQEIVTAIDNYAALYILFKEVEQ